MNQQIFHDEWEEKIVARAMQELNEEESALLDQHLESCTPCTQELREYNFLVRRLRAAEKDIIVPEPSAELLAFQQEIARSFIQQEAQQIVEQAFAKTREDEPEDPPSSRSVMIPDSSMRGILRVQVSRLNERAVIADLVTNPNSEHWQMCRLYTEHIVESTYSPDLPAHLKEEVVQETLISAYRGLPKFRNECPFTSWLRKIARNRMIDVSRRQQKIKQRETYLEFLLEEDEDAKDPRVLSNTLEDVVLINEQLQVSLEAMQAFLVAQKQKERVRMILQQVLVDGYTYKQAARLIGVSVSTVADTIRAARKYM